MKIQLLALGIFAFTSTGFAEESGLSLEDILDLKLTVATKKPMSLRESPGIISIVTRGEIKNMGARTMVDILRLIPGFEFAVDYNSTITIGIRGLNSVEGKILLLLDGQDLTELAYNVAFLNQRFPIESIDRIEIIRGPGSAMYGGAAEYAVINVITQSASQIHGVQVNTTYSLYPGTYGQRGAALQLGHKLLVMGQDFEISAKGYLAQIQRTDRDFSSPNGEVRSSVGNLKDDTKHLNLGLSFAGLSARYIHDEFNSLTPDASYSIANSYSGLLSYSVPVNFSNRVFSVKYDAKVLSNVTITPEYYYKVSRSYNITDNVVTYTNGGAANSAQNLKLSRHRVGIAASWDPIESLNVQVGADHVTDLGRNESAAADYGATYYFTTDPADKTFLTPQIRFTNRVLYTQGLLKTDFGNWVVGGRYESHSKYGSAAVPRFGWTKVWEPIHLKLMYSGAFRSPSMINVTDAAYGGNSIVPERTHVYEAEIGAELNKINLLTLSLFELKTTKVLVYTPAGSYQNGEKTGSRGVELEHRLNLSGHTLTSNYSYYTVKNINEVPRYAVTGDSGVMMGYAPHKFTTTANVRVLPSVYWNASLIHLSDRTTYLGDANQDDVMDQVKLGSTNLVNTFVNATDVGMKGLDIGVGVYDLFASKYKFAPAYSFSRNPLPAPTRDLVFKLGYKVEI